MDYVPRSILYRFLDTREGHALSETCMSERLRAYQFIYICLEKIPVLKRKETRLLAQKITC